MALQAHASCEAAMTNERRDVWAAGNLYEPYVGRWSRLVAGQLLGWLDVPRRKIWLDVGCGTGALTGVILRHADPQTVISIDSSSDYVAHARAHVIDARSSFAVADAQALPFDAEICDAAASGLVLNFLPRPPQAVAEMARVVRPGGLVAAYVWDYAGKIEFMRHFWDAAAALDPAASDLDEGRRFPLCQPAPLADLFTAAGLRHVNVSAIDVSTRFKDFDDFWSPFLGGQGPAPGYAMSLGEADRAALRERIRAGLPVAEDGSIHLTARAWAVQGRVL
jgi:SAM-dependent methyltransferase